MAFRPARTRVRRVISGALVAGITSIALLIPLLVMNIPKRVCDRLVSGMKQMRPIIEQQKTRDVSEADTVTLVKDLLAEIFGFDKWAELTGEHAFLAS